VRGLSADVRGIVSALRGAPDAWSGPAAEAAYQTLGKLADNLDGHAEEIDRIEAGLTGAMDSATAARTDAVLDSSRAGAAWGWSASARSRTVRVPEPASRTTNGVAASVDAEMRRRGFDAHGCVGPTTTRSSSVPTSRRCRPGGASGPSTNPSGTSPLATIPVPPALFCDGIRTPVRSWSAPGGPACAPSRRRTFI
jgi:hypothetical protein